MNKFPKRPSNTAALTGRHFLSCFYNMLLVAGLFRWLANAYLTRRTCVCDAAGLSSALALTPQLLLWRVFFKTKVWLIRMVLCHAGSAPVMRMKKSTDRVFSKSVYAGNRQSAVCMGPAHQQVSFESLAGYLWCRNIHVRAVAEGFGVIFFF